MMGHPQIERPAFRMTTTEDWDTHILSGEDSKTGTKIGTPTLRDDRKIPSDFLGKSGSRLLST